LWLIVLAVLALVVCLIVYSYADWPGSGYIGIGDKKFWDYLELLIVPAALAFGVYWLNQRQTEREHQADAAQRERELEVENQRAQDTTLQTYIDKLGRLVDAYRSSVSDVKDARLEYERWSRTNKVYKNVTADAKGNLEDPRGGGGSIGANHLKDSLQAAQGNYEDADIKRKSRLTEIRTQTLTVLDRIEDRLQGADEPRGYKRRKKAVMRALDEQGLLNLGGPETISIEDANFTYADLKSMNLSPKNLQKARLTGADLSDTDLVGADLTGADLKGVKGVTNEEIEQQAAFLKGATMPNGQKYEDWLKSTNSEEDT
jgi:hypothetical protein